MIPVPSPGHVCQTVQEHDRPILLRRWRALRIAGTLAPAAFFLIGALARRWMDDDGFINLRVVRNLLHGDGPVFNLDERVEAVTSPLWVACLSLGGALGLRLEAVAVFGAIALSVLGVLLAQSGAARLSRTEHAPASTSFEQRLRQAPLPLGAAVVAALPPFWDYASSGLETGLALGWLGATFLAVATCADPPPRRHAALRSCVYAFVIGLGPLIRPDMALYTAASLALLLASDLARTRGVVARVAATARALACAGAIPLSYEVFRAGYYGALVPNTALAKEAFATRYDQGLYYFHNFFGTYAMAWPLAACAVFFALRFVATADEPEGTRRFLVRSTMLVYPAAAAAHAFYIVRIGGDYMHGRMFVPVIFAAILPLANIPAPHPRPAALRAAAAAAAAVIALWLPICALHLRVAVDNDHDIGDERGWYARQAKRSRPVWLEDYQEHAFYANARDEMSRVDSICRGLARRAMVLSRADCRRFFVNADDLKTLAPVQTNVALGAQVDPRISATVSYGAIGIVGAAMPPSVHIFDRHGLADPFVARANLQERGRPGHEKTLPAAWAIARYTDPAPAEDASISAARRALGCGALAELDRTVRGPLTWQRVIENVKGAWRRDRLRVPPDPFEAQSTFCGTPAIPTSAVGGRGGKRFQWRCPDGVPMTGVAGQVDERSHAVASVYALCGTDDAEQSTLVTGPSFGEGAGTSFRSTCHEPSAAIALRARADNLVRALRVECATPADGDDGDRRTRPLQCPPGWSLVGIEGRAGSLVDAVGPACSMASVSAR